MHFDSPLLLGNRQGVRDVARCSRRSRLRTDITCSQHTWLKALGILPESVELRQVKYLNNIVEQDHRFIKRLVKPGLGFFSFETAGRTLQGHEVMNMISKGQMQVVDKGDIPSQVAFIARLFGVAA
jgi:transposase-like protein